MLGRWNLYQSKAHSRLDRPPNTKFCFICRCLAGIPMASYCLQFDPNLGVSVLLGWGTKMVLIEILCPHSYSISLHIKGLSCTVLAQCTSLQTDGWTDTVLVAVGQIPSSGVSPKTQTSRCVPNHRSAWHDLPFVCG